ncbi:AAA family ATPase [Streptomyces sp. NBC_01335]|uniref:AAA family ATPase n=1 Tax=Streptomyces sp. NBC_01335 TaxID=2903828 RepID=UPI002E10D083|nr:AAA family ATPase [Streptomyces sp. NBC_01335]
MSTTTREEVLAGEQKAVDHAYDCYTTRLAEMTGTSAATAAATAKDGIANRMDAEARAEAYGGLGDEALVFSRVDAPEEPGGAPRPWYIGRRGVRDAENEPVVLLWTSPLAKKWADARPEDPGEVELRRQLRCAQQVVEEYFDDIAPSFTAVPVREPEGLPGQRDAEEAPAPDEAHDGTPTEDAAEAEGSPLAEEPRDAAAPQAPHVPHVPSSRRKLRTPSATPGDVARARRRKPAQPDDFLLRELQRSRGGRMRDIVETIRRDQMDLVTGSPSDILVVQGGPGTGKSAVGLHRVTWLVSNDHFNAANILVIGPHQRFLEYVGEVLPTLGTRDVNAVQLSRLWDGELLGTDGPQARAVKADERMAAVLRRRVEHECRPEAVDGQLTPPSFEGDEPAFTVTAGSATLRIAGSEVRALLAEARSGEAAYRERRDRFRSLIVDRLLRELTAIAPRRGADGTIRRSLERNRRVERLIDRVWPSPGARESLRTLYDSPELLRACAEDVLSEDERRALHRPRAARADGDPWTLDDRVCLEELRYLIAGEIPRRYGHIVVDEAQDLTPMQARALRRRVARGGSMTVLGDLAQATGPVPYTTWDRLGTLLSDHGDWRVAELTTSYRVPAEIMEFVAPLARVVAPSLPYPRAVREAGTDAVRTLSTEPWKLLDDTVAQVTRLVGTNDGRTLRSVAVIVPDDSRWLEEISGRLDRSPEITGPGRAAVSVLAAAQAKGMEYDHVLVLEPATIADTGPAGLRQLYIALTRSTQSLTVLHTSPLPEALTRTDDGTGAPAPDAPAPGTSPARTAAEGGTPPAGEAPGIGSDIRVRVLGPGPGGRYRVKALAPAVDRPLVLTVRHGSAPPRPGQELDTWVFANETNHSVLTADERGRLPISPRMADRYLGAVTVMAELLAPEAVSESVPDARARLSELQGMANRVLRRDQADWVDVRHVLGSPDRERLGVLRDLAAGTNRALKDGILDTARLSDELAGSGWLDALAEARETLRTRGAGATGTAARAEEPAAEPGVPDPAPEAVPADPAPRPEQPPQKESDPVTPVTTTAEDAPAPAHQEGLLQALVTSAAADRTCKKHEAVRLMLMSALLWADIQPTESEVVDVSCVTDRGLFLYEVLGAGRAGYEDLRAGATRLLEIDHTLPAPAAARYLVLCEPPTEDWSADTVRDVFGAHVLWRTPDGWGGEDTATALGLV